MGVRCSCTPRGDTIGTGTTMFVAGARRCGLKKMSELPRHGQQMHSVRALIGVADSRNRRSQPSKD